MSGSGPGTPTVAELMHAAVAAAVMAPSSHNTQPWRFRLAGAQLELRTDPRRQLRVIDPDHRQLTISCGCALYNARLALRAAGYGDEVEITADHHPPGLLAILAIGHPAAPTATERELAMAIPRRRTNRRAFLPRPIGAAVTASLIDAARRRGVTMVRLDPERKRAIGEVVSHADCTQYADPAFRAELARWLAPAASRRRDGIPFVEKEYGSARPFAIARALGSPELGAEFGALEDRAIGLAPAVMVLGTPCDGPRAWLRCGEALQDTLLRATLCGLSASFLNQALEVPALRAEIAAVVPEVGYPLMIFRLGVPAAPLRRAAPRRSVADVLEVAW